MADKSDEEEQEEEEEWGEEEEATTAPLSCLGLGWTQWQISTFQRDWKKLKGNTPQDMKSLGINLALWMFDIMPEVRERFSGYSRVSKDEVTGDDRFFQHSLSIVNTLDDLIGLLEDPAFVETARSIVQSHLSKLPPVTVRIFKDLRDEIHSFISDVTGLDKDSEMSRRWYQFFDIFVQLGVEEGEEELLEDENQTNKCCPFPGLFSKRSQLENKDKSHFDPSKDVT